MPVLVDTSVWVDYFRGGAQSIALERLIDDNLLVTNDVILAELIPYLRLKRQSKLIRLLQAINKLPLSIHWPSIIECQVKCLKAGANGIGIPDLLIAQNALGHGCAVYSLDKHFELMQKAIKVQLY